MKKENKSSEQKTQNYGIMSEITPQKSPFSATFGGKLKKVADKNELLLVFDENGNSTGIFKMRDAVHSGNLFHREVALWVLNLEDGTVLLQRRSKEKKQNPNKLGLCAGHVAGDDSVEETLEKEFFEEYGLKLSDYEVKPLCVLKRETPGNHHFSNQFYITASIPLGDIKVQEEELSEVIYLDYKTLKARVKAKDNEFVFDYEAYKPVFKVLDKIFAKSKEKRV